MKNWISFPRREGTASRQAHTKLPEGTYERELGKEGFFGPATQMYHAHPPTGWVKWEGDLRPRAFDLTKHQFHLVLAVGRADPAVQRRGEVPLVARGRPHGPPRAQRRRRRADLRP